MHNSNFQSINFTSLSLYANTCLAQNWYSRYYTAADARCASPLQLWDANPTVSRDTTACSLCNVATSQFIHSTYFLLYANIPCPHLLQSLLHRRRFKVRKFFATPECRTHGESHFHRPLSVLEQTAHSVHTLNIYFCVRRPHVLLKSGYPAIPQRLIRRAQQALCNFEPRL